MSNFHPSSRVVWLAVMVVATHLATGKVTACAQTKVDAENVPISELPQFSDEIPVAPQAADAGRGSAPLGAPANSRKVPAKYDVTRIGDRAIGAGVNFYSLEREQTMGKQMAEDLEQTARLVTDPVITEYVNRVGQRIVRNSDAQVPFTIKVIDNDEVNAFALPGGFFYVNSGLLLAAENEAELAAVMAHEIAHVAARHATKNFTKMQIWNLASIPLIFMGGPAGYAVRQAAGIMVPMSYLKFSRNVEREADLLGLQYAYAAGYDPQAFVEFFEKLESREKKHHSAIAKAFATHPMTEDRVKAAEKAINDYLPAREEYLVTTSEFDTVRARLLEVAQRHRLHQGKVQPTLRQRQRGASVPESKKGTDADDEDQRPTLRRAPQE